MKYRNIISTALVLLCALVFSGCGTTESQATKEADEVNAQQKQYAIGQPIPKFDWSLERDLMIKLYELRNKKVSTHAVWRSDRGMVEGDCPSLGFGLPYDVSLTNPVMASKSWWGAAGSSIDVVEQAEPNGIFASKNTSATWVMCVGDAGMIEPIYVETKVTIYPYDVEVDYDKNRVKRIGATAVNIGTSK